MNITEEQEMIEYWQSKMKEQEYPSDYGGEDFWKDDGWLLTVSYNPTQSKIEEFVFNMLVSEIERVDLDNIDIVRFNHWACGWVKQINLRPIVNGRLTVAGAMVREFITSDGQMDYLERVHESEDYWQWERECYQDYVHYMLHHVLKDIDGDAFEVKDEDALVDYLIGTGMTEVDPNDSSVHQWFADCDEDWYEILDDIMGDRPYKLEELE